ncbi:hypothetical protein NDI85_04760 [Halomicroarcula sp. S1AR25-4]|uniref:DUF6653 family protein n=1 Tax=Haloarcula sp. S1AR25-4 TaxID=2950538 RepID=UPI00287466FB|nr:DUF6653 family protein [Halomicroarcula sp. S1AR25-4]MDS0277091.1 hypothetical protein [Halomicroarcula sp. S1AR25-4]
MAPSPLPSDDSVLDRYFWARHANPLSGWSRVPTLPLLITCLYRRDWRGLALTLAFVVVNPFLFAPPEDDSAWMTKGVYGERLWTKGDHDATSYPTVLNYLTGVAALYALYAAVRRRPAETALATALSMALKLWFVAEMVHLYEAERDASAGG